MPVVDFEARLIFDESFYESEIKKNYTILRKLMYINDRARGFKRNFNILPKKIFNKILKNNPSMSRALLRSSFYDMEEESLEEINDEIELIVKYAIYSIKEFPKKRLIIITSEENEKVYLENVHFKSSKDVLVKSGQEAIDILEEFWVKCTAR
jgi:hypothetical protein